MELQMSDLDDLKWDARQDAEDEAREARDESDTRGGFSYNEWMRKVNNEVISLAGVSTDDLADFDSWDEWDSGTSPRDAAILALEGSNFPFDDEMEDDDV
jgi:hypothetical protein